MREDKTFEQYGDNFAELHIAIMAAGGMGMMPNMLQMSTQTFLALLAKNHISIVAQYKGERTC